MKNLDAIRPRGQVIRAVAESVWKRVLDQVLGLLLLAGSGLAFFLGLGMDFQESEARMMLILIHVFVSLLLIIVGTTEIPRDMATRNIQFFLSKPLGRPEYLLGKFAGIFILGELILAVYAGCFGIGMIIRGSGELNGLAIDFLRMTLQLAVLSALLVGVSAVLPEITATIFGVAFYILSQMVFVLPTMLRVLLPEWLHPPFLAIYYLLPNSHFYLWSGEDVRMGYFLFLLLVYSVSYCAFALTIANFWFRRRDLN